MPAFPRYIAPCWEFREHKIFLDYRSDHIVPWTWDAHATPINIWSSLPTPTPTWFKALSPLPLPCPAIISSHLPWHAKNPPLSGCSLHPPAAPAQAASICPSPKFQRPSMTAEIYNLSVPFCWAFFFLFLRHHWYTGLSQHHQRGCRCLKGPQMEVIRVKHWAKTSNLRFWNMLCRKKKSSL